MANEPQSLWRETWALLKPYWTSDRKLAAYGLLAVVIGLNLGLVYLEVLFNDWQKVFYDALQNKDEAVFWTQLGRFCLLATAFILVAVYRVYLQQMLSIRWRQWMTDRYLSDWLGGRAFYRMQMLDAGTDNPDQRIADDIRLFISLTLSLSLGLLSAVVTLFSFMFILWSISGPLRLTLMEQEIVIPGYMLWAAVLYAIVGTWITHLVGRPLIRLNFDRQRYEADFRFALVRLRENAEAAALLGGEAREKAAFMTRFELLVENFWAIMRRQKRVTTLTTGYTQVAVVFPFVVAAPRYFSGAIQLGDLIQISSAFGQVQTALSYIVNSYTDLAEWRAVVERLAGFRRALEAAQRTDERQAIGLAAGDGPNVGARGLELALPDGRVLLAETDFQIAPGERLLVVGRSGSGKSTLFRALSGLWRHGRGDIQVPAGARVLFLPQKPYMPLGSLAECLCYPEDPETTTDAAKERALADVGLEQFTSRLAEVQNWGQILSLGEQQRLAIARALLKKPDWLFLDEATASLDPALEDMVYRRVAERLPRATVVSIGHRDSLVRLHDRVMRIEPQEGGPARLVSASS